MQNYKLERKVKNRDDWEKSIKEAKVRIGLVQVPSKKKQKKEED
jgi:NADH/NAD ratio-sensing transcriptional regulator Rex